MCVRWLAATAVAHLMFVNNVVEHEAEEQELVRGILAYFGWGVDTRAALPFGFL